MADFGPDTGKRIAAMRKSGNLIGLIKTAYAVIQALAALREPYNRVVAETGDADDQIIYDIINAAYSSGELSNAFLKAGALQDAVSSWDPMDELLQFNPPD